jgi:YcxB-like protein
MLMAWMLVMCLPLPVVSCHAPPGAPFPVLYSILCFVIVLVFELVLMTLLQVFFQVVWLLVNKNRGVVGEFAFEIRDDGLLEKTSFNESLHRWAGFHRIAASGAYFFVFVTDNNVQYIPFRAFPSKEEAGRFEAELRRRVKAAQGN